jgi:hypothetical protein
MLTMELRISGVLGVCDPSWPAAPGGTARCTLSEMPAAGCCRCALMASAKKDGEVLSDEDNKYEVGKRWNCSMTERN